MVSATNIVVVVFIVFFKESSLCFNSHLWLPLNSVKDISVWYSSPLINVLNVAFIHVMGAKDLQCKYMSLLVSLQKTVVFNFPFYLINKTSKNDILRLCSKLHGNLIF